MMAATKRPTRTEASETDRQMLEDYLAIRKDSEVETVRELKEDFSLGRYSTWARVTSSDSTGRHRAS